MLLALCAFSVWNNASTLYKFLQWEQNLQFYVVALVLTYMWICPDRCYLCARLFSSVCIAMEMSFHNEDLALKKIK